MASFTSKVECAEPRTVRDWIDDTLKRGQSTSKEGLHFMKGGEHGGLRTSFTDFSSIKVEDIGRSAHELIRSGAAGKVGYGFVVGYCSGFAVKKVARVAAFVIGGAFVVVQSLAYQGYVSLNQEKVKGDFEFHLDLNKDGRLDAKDVEVAYSKLNSVLSYNLPTGGGFSAGLLLGLRN